MAQKLTDDKKKKFNLTPPPCWIMTRLLPSASSGPEATLMPNPGPGEVSATATAPPPAFP